MNKSKLRATYKAQRTALSIAQRDQLSFDIANKTLELPIWDKTYYHIFLPIEKQKEVDTQYILHILQGKDKHIVVPKTVRATSALQHVLLMDNTRMELNEWGIPEPVTGIEIEVNKLDVVFIPLLAYDINGNRVGYGKGYYDAFLAHCKSDTLKIGLSFFLPEKKIEELLPTDVSLDYCVTASTIFEFKKH